MYALLAARYNRGMGHDHDHSHVPTDRNAAFAIGVALNVGFVVAETVFGLIAHSVSLVADAAHNLGDVLGLLLAWGAIVLAKRRPTARWTYGLRRSSILAALVNAVVLLVAVGGIAWEAVRRLIEPSVGVSGKTVMIVAAVGIVVNGATALLFRSGREHDVNIEGAFLHMAADAATSAGVVVAGALILFAGRQWIDPAVSLALAAAITWSTWGLLRKSGALALDAVPHGIDPLAVRAHLEAMPGVRAIHDLHIWPMSTTEAAMTVHLVMPAGHDDAFLGRVVDEVHDEFGIEHATVQIETGDPAVRCKFEPESVV